jgi:hypothetical protein
MRTARLSSRFLAQPSRLFSLVASRQTPPDTPTTGSRSPKSSVSATDGRMTHRALPPGPRLRSRPISGYPPNRPIPSRDPAAPPLAQDLTPVIEAWRLPRGRTADGSAGPGQHESTIHLFAHASRRMMSCSIVDDPRIAEGGRPNQIVGPNRDHGQLGNARTGPRAMGTGASG